MECTGVHMVLIKNIFLVYLIIMNLAGFALMGLDKYKARRHLWRIPERTLFAASLLGGMYFFRHKTKHWYFVAGMPAILIVQAGIYLYFR